MEKKKRIISQENLEPKVLEMLNKKYPNGYTGFIQNITSPKGEMLHVVPLETEDSIYLVKVKVNAKKNRGGGGGDDDDDDEFSDDIPEAGDGFDGDKDEFGNDEEEDNYGDGPAEEMGEEDDED